MSQQNLTAPETARIRHRVQSEEIPATITVAVESPKRKVESSAAEFEPALFQIAKRNRSALSTSPLKPLPSKEKSDSAADYSPRLRLFSFGSAHAHAASSTACSEDESSSGGGIKSVDPAANSSHLFEISFVSTSAESEVCVDSSDKEMDSKSTESSTQRQSVGPTAEEIEVFFSAAEKIEAQRFKDKYNFDIVNDVPVKGRFEWSRVKH